MSHYTRHNAKIFKYNPFIYIMDSNIFTKIVLESERALSSVENMATKRDLFQRVAAPTDYFVGIKGLRGVGKTTLLLQIARTYKNPLYFSADAIYLSNSPIYEI